MGRGGGGACIQASPSLGMRLDGDGGGGMGGETLLVRLCCIKQSHNYAVNGKGRKVLQSDTRSLFDDQICKPLELSIFPHSVHYADLMG